MKALYQICSDATFLNSQYKLHWMTLGEESYRVEEETLKIIGTTTTKSVGELCDI